MGDLLIYLKIHNSENGKVVAMCDESLIDKVLDDGDIEIDIKSYSKFYKGELIEKESVPTVEELGELNSVNIVGDESVGIAVERSLVDKSSVKRVGDVPYAQAFKMKS